MSDHPAPNPPRARREVVRYDLGGWISGPSITPSTEPVPAEEVEEGDVLLLDDGTHAEVTDTAFGFYWLADGHEPGVAIGWRSGSSSGLMFRRAADILLRAAGEA
jgi:hypothetical protein